MNTRAVFELAKIPVYLFAIFAFTFCNVVRADDSNLGAIKAQSAQLIAKDDLTALLTGASLTRQVERGEVHINTLKDGSLNSDFKSKMRNVNQIKGYGTWKVSDDGKYCFDIKWNRGFDDVSGCRSMYKIGDDYYSAGSDGDDAKTYHYKISK